MERTYYILGFILLTVAKRQQSRISIILFSIWPICYVDLPSIYNLLSFVFGRHLPVDAQPSRCRCKYMIADFSCRCRAEVCIPLMTFWLLMWRCVSCCCTLYCYNLFIVYWCWTCRFQWYNETGDVDRALSVMMKALEKHTAAITAGGQLSCSVSLCLHVNAFPIPWMFPMPFMGLSQL